MLDLRRIREETALVKAGLARRGNPAHLAGIDRVIELDEQRRALIGEVEALRARRNEESQKVATLKREKKNDEADAIIRSTRELGERMTSLEARLGEVETALRDTLLVIPNIPDEVVPEGGESASLVLREWGGEPSFAFQPKPHWEIGENLGILDLARGAKLAGSGFVVLRGTGARLTRALMSFFLDVHTREHGYEEVWVPLLANRATMTGTGQLPKFADDMYHVVGDDLFLVPTAEVPVTNLYRDELLAEDQLPLGHVAYTPCFRREAGAAGKDTRGLLRLHQFDKVEIVRFTTPEQSPEEHERLTRHAEVLLERLELPYRRVLLAAGDTGHGNAKTWDLEGWAPGVGKWLELSSCSTFTDYQARRANIRYRPAGGGKPRFVHTLNGSGLAFPRVIACLLEHHQQADGSVAVPAALRPYLGTDVIR